MIHWCFTIMNKYLNFCMMLRLGLVSNVVCLFESVSLSAGNNKNPCGKIMVPLINELQKPSKVCTLLLEMNSCILMQLCFPMLYVTLLPEFRITLFHKIVI